MADRSFQALVDADRRLAILRFLSDEQDYSMGDSLMQKGLSTVGHDVSRTKVRADFDHLVQVGAITVNAQFEGTVHVARITEVGLDAAQGRRKLDGVARPSP